MVGFVQGSPSDGLGEGRSNWQSGRGESTLTSTSNAQAGEEIDTDTSHLADVHAAGGSPCPGDMYTFKEVQTMGK